ncbi:MAG: BatA domain-containing protein, partial [Halobacteriales archaeon]|nr:BatA domain-containing protein [Halobacteriales archaeon]
MALADVFLRPIGLLGLLALIPLVLLYLLRPDPATVRLPTYAFLGGSEEQGGRRAVLERLRRSLLLLIQALVLVVLATSLAAPYIPVSEEVTVEETVVVLDTSASMATRDDGTLRFGRARSRALEATSSTTSVVVSATPARVLLRRGTVADARSTLEEATVTDAPGDLRTAIDQATSIAGPDARVVVVSDFADSTDWRTAVRAARARGLRVELEQ